MTLDPYSITLSVMFGLVGIAAWRHGRRESSFRHLLIAVTLMGFPYFIADWRYMLLLGGTLTVFLFWP